MLHVLFAGILAIGSPLASAKVRLAQPFGDNMVLQAEMPIEVWGTSDAGETIEVTLGRTTKPCVANSTGQWKVEFPPLPASQTPIAFVVAGQNKLQLKNVVVGEVWLAAGQSNMEWPLSQSKNWAAERHNGPLASLRLCSMRTAARPGGGRFDQDQLERLAPHDYLRGSWQVCSGRSAASFSAVAYYFGKVLYDSIDAPIGVVCNAVGGTPTEAWIRQEALAGSPQLAGLVKGNWIENPKLEPWCLQRAKENLNYDDAHVGHLLGDAMGPYHPFRPGYMWQAGMSTLSRLRLRGVIWYQGESNAESPERVEQHRHLFELQVSDWRTQFHRPQLPFLFVQLPALNRSHWPAFRQGQLDCCRTIANTGVVVTIDLGHPTNVHPIDKQPVGQRLANLAFARVYQQSQAGPSLSPIAVKAKLEGSKTYISFHPSSGRIVTHGSESIRHFQLAGNDRKFRMAEARVDGQHVVVWSSVVSAPKYVRYAWQAYPSPPVNLFNDLGLPAAPFELPVVPDSD